MTALNGPHHIPPHADFFLHFLLFSVNLPYTPQANSIINIDGVYKQYSSADCVFRLELTFSQHRRPDEIRRRWIIYTVCCAAEDNLYSERHT